ncbi:hypothetical protein ACHAWF_011894 [Thalassiosira exigua]
MAAATYESVDMDEEGDRLDDEAAPLVGDGNGGTGGGRGRRFASSRTFRLGLAALAAAALAAYGLGSRFPLPSSSSSSGGRVDGQVAPAERGDGLPSILGGGSVIDVGINDDEALLPALPAGVNLASWFSLEDWFFVGSSGAVEVASPDDAVAASCLPPLHVDSSTGPRWNSETDLLAGLAKHYDEMTTEEGAGGGNTLGGYPNDKTKQLGGWGKAIKAVHAFRSSFYDPEEELRTLNRLGIKHVRVPLSWCWTDRDPSKELARRNGTANDDEWIYMDDEEVKETFTCRDPYHDDVHWPAIPRHLLARFLRACAKHDVGATLDLHTYPGGTSIGTFSGVWPKYARFWTHGDVPATDRGEPDRGRTLLRDFVRWLESLAEEDPLAFAGIRALSPMNEPAHLAGLYNGRPPIRADRETFLPPLPKEVARGYLSELNDGLDAQSNNLTRVPDGNHLRVFLWLRDAVDAFRASKLPDLGKELHVNVHESVFPSDVLPKIEPEADYGLATASMKVFGAWWRATTTPAERSSWAVLDVHHYHAWGPQCSGSVEGPPSGRYACSDEEAKEEVLGRCATWPSVFRAALEEECEAGLRLASAEFSASTHHSVRHACNDVATLRMMLERQVEEARVADVDLFWWAYKMPYGGAFRNAWSLKHLLYMLGALPRPDEEPFHCGDHVPPPGEPKDGSI